ncbi:MAG: dTDP-glucose 4,6-dehydratase [Flavobacteriales bacterium]|nr:dTDP-glucose 4,6-dehydratase [Flavobacteriales bacterium]
MATGDFKRALLVTGGAGFIGSHLVRRLVKNYPDTLVVNLDLLTYAGNLENLRDVENAPNYRFAKGDICDAKQVNALFEQFKFEGVFHLAAESHVDRSISDPMSFVKTNVLGTGVLLNAYRAYRADGGKFYQISTDEVFGSLTDEGFFTETTAYDPRSPYSASKASADHLVRAYHHTYHLPILISNCSNNYGSHQFPEKLIPLMINNIKQEKSLPVYGEGINVRDWLWVDDHVAAIDLIYHQGKTGDTYAIGGGNEWRNIDLVHFLCDEVDTQLQRPIGTSRGLVTFVQDRAGHDHRYAIDAAKLQTELGWKPSVTFEEGLRLTIKWYLENSDWLNHITSGNYQEYYKKHYS